MRGSLLIQAGAIHRTIALTPGRYIIGRGNETEIQIESQDVSRRHAEIVVDQNHTHIVDLGSENGTLLNGAHVLQQELKAGDCISIGGVTLRYEVSAPHPALPTWFKGRTISLHASSTLFLSGVFFSLVMAVGIPLRSLFKNHIEQEAMLRATGLVRYLAEKNREDLKMGNDLLLDVESIQKERGVQEARIIHLNGRILAPVSRLNQIDQDPFVQEALSAQSDRLISPGPPLPNGTRIWVHPIRSYNDKMGKYETLGVAKLIFSTQDAVGSFLDIDRWLLLMSLFALLLAGLLGWGSSKLLTVPLQRLAEKVRGYGLGERNTSGIAPFREWEPLFSALDRQVEDPIE